MGSKKAQISMEYLIIVGFVIFAILIPAFMLLFSSTNRNVGSLVNTQKINDLGNGLINDAKQMYYLGIYSTKIAKYDMPSHVKNIFILNMTELGKEYHYLGIYVQDGENEELYTFLSSVPLTSDLNNNNVELDETLFSMVKECSQPNFDCDFINFKGTTIKPGKKQFRIETVLQDGGVKSSIAPYIQ